MQFRMDFNLSQQEQQWKKKFEMETKKWEQKAKAIEEEVKKEEAKRVKEATKNLFINIKDIIEIRFGKDGVKLFTQKINKLSDKSQLADIRTIAKAYDTIDEIEEYIDNL